jgi:hypothetical protein
MAPPEPKNYSAMPPRHGSHAAAGTALDFPLARLLWEERFPRHGQFLAAWNVRSVEARLA